MDSFQGKKVLIFGLGVLGGGVGAARFFAEEKAKVRVTDLKHKEELKESISKLSGYKIEYVLGRHRYADFDWADLVIRNPGVQRESLYLKYCFKKKKWVEMAESLLAKLTRARIIGVTGTRGKSTTSSLTYEFLKMGGFDVYLGGNMPGKSSLELLKKTDEESIIVLELSSWQLQAFGWGKISPWMAVVTNIYEDHLNRYKNIKEYIDDKKNIVKFQKANDVAFLNKENREVVGFASETRGRVIFYNKNSLPDDIEAECRLKGEHNKENVAAAFKVGKYLGISDEKIKKALRQFEGLAHRLQLVREINGVKFYNDTTSTTPVATIKALDCFKKGKIVLIAGGNKKNLTIDDLAEKICKRVKGVVFLKGDGTNELRELLKKKKFEGEDLGVFHKMQEAVKRVKKITKRDDIVLLSPGFTSFSMYKNEFERGEDFINVVKNL